MEDVAEKRELRGANQGVESAPERGVSQGVESAPERGVNYRRPP